jgi:heme exporter protein D
VRDAIDFSSFSALASTLLGLAVVTLVAIGIRLLVMQTVQQRRERENRQINERLRTLIAAYKTLGGSFTGDLAVDPTHLRDLRAQAARAAGTPESGTDTAAAVDTPGAGGRGGGAGGAGGGMGGAAMLGGGALGVGLHRDERP